MATRANIFENFLGARAVGDTTTARTVNDAYRLRNLPNEDIFLYIKRIDNSKVARQADPRARVRDWKLAGGAGFAALALIGVLLPSTWGYLDGYQLSKLQQENHRLTTERSRLDLEEAKLISAERLHELAQIQEFVDPTPDSTVYLSPKNDGSLALNKQR